MVATPQYATLKFRKGYIDENGTFYPSSDTVQKEVYLSDVANAQINWDSGNGAGSASETFWNTDDDVALEDFSIATGMADTVRVRVIADGEATGDTLRYAPHVNTIATRPQLSIVFPANTKLSMIQLA